MKKENLYTPDCIRTFTGQYVNVFDPDPSTINIEDIAHGLSMQPRFAGHLPLFYSVAQHSLMVSDGCLKENKLAGLLHDASEAYLSDIPTPIKNRIPQYKEIENNLMLIIADKFGFQYPLHKDVKINDRKQLENEWYKIMLGNGNNLGILSPKDAKKMFLFEFTTI